MSDIGITYGTVTILMDGETVEVGAAMGNMATHVRYNLADLEAAYAQVHAAITATDPS
jgi:hypothetical protein